MAHKGMMHIQCLKNARFDEQEAIFDQLFRNFHVQKACIDQTGIGRQFLERAQTRIGMHAIEGVQFTQNTKDDLAYHLKTHVDRHTLRIPREETLITDLLSLRINENARLSAQHSSNGHADRFWALALALQASRNTPHFATSTELFHANKHFTYEN